MQLLHMQPFMKSNFHFLITVKLAISQVMCDLLVFRNQFLHFCCIYIYLYRAEPITTNIMDVNSTIFKSSVPFCDKLQSNWANNTRLSTCSEFQYRKHVLPTKNRSCNQLSCRVITAAHRVMK
jgi:hypothetical protein